jgi:predicted methyltransferase
MARFDDWVTDPEVTVDRVQAFVNEPGRVGERFLG